jgi:hypothetical protein
MRLACGVLLLFLTTSYVTAADDDFTVRTEKTAPPAELDDSVKEKLLDEALRVESKGTLVCTIWFRKEIPIQATADQLKNGLTYSEIPKTTVVGAIELPQKWIDFRKQEIPKGVYTLRFVIQPQNGDHDGTAPHTEFCLLSPAHLDKKSETMEMKALIEMSATITGSTHPSVLLLFPNSKPADQAKIIDKGKGIWVVHVKGTVVVGEQKAPLGFGFTIAGHTMD